MNPGGSATFNAVVTGTAPFTYQWRFNGGALANETNTSLTINNAQCPNEGSYDVIVANVNNSVTSAPATLVVLENVPPSIR